MGDELEAIELSIRIDEKLFSLSTVSSSECCIFRVPNPLRQTNEKAYEPHIISIGPYHHGKDHLKGMEVHKMHYLERLLRRRKETSVQRYVVALKGMEETIRKCYAEPLDHIDGKALVEMMLLDGCFITELIRKDQIPESGELRGVNDGFRGFNSVSLIRDLLLMENQIPFFVLLELFRMSLVPNQKNNFITMALEFFTELMPGGGIQPSSLISDQNHKNLLGLVHDSWLPSPEAIRRYRKNSAKYAGWKLIRSATELQEAGIKFKNRHKETSLFDIKFKCNALWIPTITIQDDTEAILRNLIAYEQCHKECPGYVTDYVAFMDRLINTGKDVELLCRSSAIDNWLGDNEAVATIFNGLGDSVELFEEYFYSEIFFKVTGYCNRKRNLWMANLWDNYFNTPWALISFLAAVCLLILTAVQTIYSVLSYYQQ